MPETQHLVLLGCGHSHLEVLKRFGERPAANVRLTVVSWPEVTPYSGLLPGFVAGQHDACEMNVAVAPLAKFAGAEFVAGEAMGLDADAKRIFCRDGRTLSYDLLSLDIGSTPDLSVSGAAEHVIPVKPIARFADRWTGFLDGADDLLVRPQGASVVVVGSGAAGVEIAFAINHRLRQRCSALGIPAERCHVILVGGSERIVPSESEAVSRRLNRAAAQRGLRILNDHRVSEIEVSALHFADNKPSLAADAVFWAVGSRSAGWLTGTCLDLGPSGSVLVDDHLRSLSHRDVFVAGDASLMINHKRPKSGVIAVRQGPPLAGNLRAVVEGRETRAFKPQKDWLKLISTGDRYAVATRNRLSAEGRWVWYWKNWIDRSFVRRYRDLAER